MRTLGKPEPELLEALLDGVDVEALVEKTRAVAAGDLLETAFAVPVQVYEFLQMCTREQRALLRTCSHQLIALAMDQACHLEAIQRRELDRARERQDAQAQLEHLAHEGWALCGQALESLKKVGGTDLAEFAGPYHGAETPSAALIVAALRALAGKAETMLGHASPKVQLRTVLYGLDRTYVESLVKAASELDRCAKAVQTKPPGTPPQKELEQTRAVTWLIVNHFVDAFDVARRVDKVIPVLDVRRLSPGAAPVEAPKAARHGAAAAPAARGKN